MIQNPIIRGFQPDPSICRVGEEYYIATSTFEWWPGIALHHSRDLAHWRLVGYALTRPEQLDLKRLAPSTGVWAPCLTFNASQALFYLCYTVCKSVQYGYFDVDNYIVTSPSIRGPWSDPIYLNSSGFDPSLFHGADGRQWVTSLVWDFREGYEHPGFIVIQEYSAKDQRLVGERTKIYRSSELGCVEGPHIFRRNGFYYLMTAEGGTGYGHACMLARSGDLFGPYEPSPLNPLFTSAVRHYNGIEHLDYRKPFLFNPQAPLQKTGHGSFVETPDGESYVVHLCARPLLPELRCPLGRETAIQRVDWTSDGWLRLADGGTIARGQVARPRLAECAFPTESARDHFDDPTLRLSWNSLRAPVDPSWASLTDRPGFLRLRGRESLTSLNAVSFLGRRIDSFEFRAETCVEFEPQSFQQMAGLACMYDNANHYYVRVYWSESLGSKCLGLVSLDNGTRSEHRDSRVPVPRRAPVYLRVEVNNRLMQFWYSMEGQQWKAIGPGFDFSKLSDEYCVNGQFTGAFVGVTAQDFERRRAHADFDYFDYYGESHATATT